MVLLEDDNPKVLLVDDKVENIAILVDMLKPLGLELFVALNAEEVFNSVESNSFDLILLDIVMPNIDGYEVCKRLKASSKHKDIPLIFISALSGVEDKIKGFSYGGDDYITKPLVQKELLARVKLHLQKGMLFKSLKQLLRKSYHELYNPLAIINTSLEMQNIKYGTSSYTDAITVASRTLQVVYDDLYYSLSARQEHTAILAIDLTTFVKNRINYFHYLINSKNVTIAFNGAQDSIVHMRESDLLRIVDNTISNAIKYARAESRVTIDIINAEDEVIFMSHNSGSQIKNPQNIFKKSYREDFEQIGMGIGLEIVSSICNLYDIKPEVVSQNGETTFKYFIPKAFK